MIRSASDTPSPRTLPRKLLRGVLFLGAAAAAIVAINGAYTLQSDPGMGDRTGAIQTPTWIARGTVVRVDVARMGNLTQRLTTSGIVRSMRDVEIQARVGGMITGLAVSNGSPVARGDTLLRLDGREYRVAYERARAGLLNAQIEFRSLSSTPFLPSTDPRETGRRIEEESRALDSLRALYSSGRVDDATYERLSREREAALAYVGASRGDVIAARSGLAAAREAFETARLDLEWTAITAPFDGVVADCVLTPGMHITPGASLLRVLDPHALLVDVEILENEAGQVAVGQAARVLLAGLPGKEFNGAVLHLNPVVDLKARTMKVTIAMKEGPGGPGTARSAIRPGMFATVYIDTRVRTHRLLVPRSAVLVRDERSLVFTMDHGRAQWHYVETGEFNDEMIVILSGLATGDTVIVDGHYTLAHDAPVSVSAGIP